MDSDAPPPWRNWILCCRRTTAWFGSVSTWTAWLVCIEALVEINAVLVSEMFHEVVVMLLELRVWTGVEVFHPGAVRLLGRPAIVVFADFLHRIVRIDDE